MRSSARRKLIALPLLLLGACQKQGDAGSAAQPKKAETGSRAEVVAKVADHAITVGELEDEINKLSPYARARYSSAPQRKEFLENLVRFEVLAREAVARGFDKDPDVQRVMRKQAINKYIDQQVDKSFKEEDVPREDVQKYYDEHKADFEQKEAVRVSQIQVADEGKAKAAVKAARTLKPDDEKGFRALVDKYSEDNNSKALGGDLSFIERQSHYPPELVSAAFDIKDIGGVAGPVKTSRGYHVLRLTARRAGFVRPLPEVERTIRQRLFREYRNKEVEELLAQLKEKDGVKLYEDKLALVKVESPTPPPGVPAALPPGAAVPTAPNTPPANPAPAHTPPAPSANK